MVRRLSSQLSTALLFSIVSFNSQAADFFGYPVFPYMGADYQYREQPFRENFGDNAFEEQYNQFNLYLGMRFWEEYLGLEINYSQTPDKSNTHQYGGNNIVNAIYIPPGNIESHSFQSKLSSFGVSLLGFYPMPFDYFCRADLFSGVGFSYANTKQIDRLTAQNNNVIAAQTYTFDESKYILRFIVGMQYLLNHNIGIRSSISWEDTSQLSDMRARETSNGPRRVALKSHWTYGVGVFLRTSRV
jgi:hypothetical protein